MFTNEDFFDYTLGVPAMIERWKQEGFTSNLKMSSLIIKSDTLYKMYCKKNKLKEYPLKPVKSLLAMDIEMDRDFIEYYLKLFGEEVFYQE